MKTSSSNICSPQCTDAEYATIDTWYKGFCGVDGAVVVTVTTSATTTGATATTGTSTTAASAAATTNVGGDSSADNTVDPPTGQAWYVSHP